MARGTLKSSFNDNGYTFIKPDAEGDDDVFLNIVHIAAGADAKLYVRGAHVEFDIVTVTRGPTQRPQARKCRLIATSPADDQSSAEEHVGRSGRVKFWSATGFGFLVDDASGEEIYANTDSVPGGYLRDGDVIEFDIRVKNERRQAINVRQAGWTKTQDKFTDELDMGSPRWAVQLAALAEPEPWTTQRRRPRTSTLCSEAT